MLDTHARRFIQSAIDQIAIFLIKLRVSPNAVTVGALMLGVAAAILVTLNATWAGVLTLWCSGVLDVVDGTMARMTRASPIGAIMDITFDRIVELSIIVALAILHPHAQLLLLILASTIAVAISLFLVIGATLRNTSRKAFQYAPGLGERTEGFILLSLMALDAQHIQFWILVFIAIIVYTMIQRFRYVMRALTEIP